jgi:hypothetical protein
MTDKNEIARRIAGCSRKLTKGMIGAGTKCQVFDTKYTRGGHKADGTLSLGETLLEKWPTDLHFTQYTDLDGVRLTKDRLCGGISFAFVAMDLDFDDHRTRPTAADFAGVLMLAAKIDPSPNIVYETRGGARWIWLIEPIRNEDVFEEHAQALMWKITYSMRESDSKYAVDLAARDWTRLYRAPHVVRDNREEFDRHIRWLHGKRLNLLKAVPAKAKRREHTRAHAHAQAHTGYSPFGADPRLETLIEGMVEGQRNDYLFRATLYALRKYDEAGQIKWLSILVDRAAGAGLGQREINTTIESASRYVEKERERE